MKRTGLVVVALAAGAGVFVGRLSPAAAMGGFQIPDGIRPLFRAAAPDEIDLVLNVGSAFSTDAGGTWTYRCDSAYQPFGSTLAPNNEMLTPSGRRVLAHFRGLLYSDDQGCTWSQATNIPTDAMGQPLPVTYAVLDPSDPDSAAWVAIDDSLYRTTDGERTVTRVKQFPGQTVLRILAPPADAKVVYLLSFSLAAGSVTYYVDSSFDGGASWNTRQRVAWGGDEVEMLFAAATDARHLYVRRGSSDQRLYTWDFDETSSVQGELVIFSTITGYRRLHVAPGEMAGELYVGIQGDDRKAGAGELWHSTDDGQSWTPVSAQQPHFRCLEARGPELWACGNNEWAVGDAFMLGVSSDGGRTWTKKLALGELCSALPCLGDKCEAVFTSSTIQPPLCAHLPDAGAGGDAPEEVDAPVGDGAAADAPDAAVDAQDAATDGPGGKSGGGCCRTGGDGRPPAWGAAALALGIAALARRRGK